MSMRSRLMYSEVYEAFVEPHQSMFLGQCFIEQEQRFIRRSQRSLRVSLSLCHVSVCVVVLVYVNVCVCICVRVCVCPQDLSNHQRSLACTHELHLWGGRQNKRRTRIAHVSLSQNSQTDCIYNTRPKKKGILQLLFRPFTRFL